MKRLILFIVAIVVSLTAIEANNSLGESLKNGITGIFKSEKIKRQKTKNSSDSKSKKSKSSFNENFESGDDNGSGYSNESDDGNESDNDDKISFYNIDDTRYQWTQGKTKTHEALMSTKGLKIVNKVESELYASTVELPVITETDDFVFGVTSTPMKLSEKSGLALLFDYQDNRNFKSILIDNAQFRYVVYKDGIQNVVKTGLVKFPKKVNSYTFYIKREGSIIHFFLNDVEYGTFKNVTITEPIFGAGVFGKASMILLKLIFDVGQNEGDTEQSTTGN